MFLPWVDTVRLAGIVTTVLLMENLGYTCPSPHGPCDLLTDYCSSHLWVSALVTSLGGGSVLSSWEALVQRIGSLVLKFFPTVQIIGPVVTVLAAPTAHKPYSGCP